MTIPVAAITENYAALKVLKKSQLSAAIGDNAPGSIEYYLNTYVRNNFIQLAKDLFDPSYDFTNDGVGAFSTPLLDQAALLAEDEIVTGDWDFQGTVGFEQPVTSVSTFTSSGQHRVKAYRITSNQSIPDSTVTAINFQAEVYDVGSLHDTSLNTSRITIPTGGAGLYIFTAQVTFSPNATGTREARIYKNGSLAAVINHVSASAGVQSGLQVTLQDQANQNDYYEVFVYQSSGGALDVVLGQNATNFSAMKVW